jgi:hypothetical protein
MTKRFDIQASADPQTWLDLGSVMADTKAVEINKGSDLPCSFAAQLRCSLVADRCGYAPRSRLAGRQNPGGILLPLFISTA